MKGLFGLLVVLLFAQPSHSQRVIEVPGGSYFPKLDENFWGNNITLRTAYLPAGAKKSWIDFEVVLPAGVLEKYYVFVHNISGTVSSSSTNIRLQIWRSMELKYYNYKLQWEKKVSVKTTSNKGTFYMWKLADSEKFRTQQGDRVGWTNEGNFGAISFQYLEGHRTFFRKVGEPNRYPTIGNEYTFDNNHLPSVFSVGVEVKPDICKLGVTGYFGNNITLRSAYFPSGGKKSWIDFEVILAAGVLQKYYAFVHNIAGKVSSSSTNLRLQIWRPIDVQNYRYKLQWEKIVTVKTTSNTGILYTWNLTDSEKFFTQQGDRIGWTNEGTVGAISFQYAEGHRTYFRKVDDDKQYPTIGNEYTFENIHFLSIFSVGVYISPNGQCATGATGPTGPGSNTVTTGSPGSAESGSGGGGLGPSRTTETTGRQGFTGPTTSPGRISGVTRPEVNPKTTVSSALHSQRTTEPVTSSHTDHDGRNGMSDRPTTQGILDPTESGLAKIVRPSLGLTMGMATGAVSFIAILVFA